jgi:cytochrome c biogenesis protein CcdA
MAGLAILVVMFWPERTARVARTVITQPVMAGGLGLLTVFFGVLLIVILAITICLSPVSLIGGLVLGAALIFGWVALGLEVGRRLAIAFKRDWQLATQAGLGTLLLSFVVYAVGIIPCIGFIFGVILWATGLGAVILTRFGGQDLPAALPPAEIQAV